MEVETLDAWLARRALDEQSGDFSLKGRHGTGGRARFQYVSANRRNRSGEILPFLLTIPHGHDRFELDGLRLELQVDHGLFTLLDHDAGVGRSVAQHQGP